LTNALVHWYSITYTQRKTHNKGNRRQKVPVGANQISDKRAKPTLA